MSKGRNKKKPQGGSQPDAVTPVSLPPKQKWAFSRPKLLEYATVRMVGILGLVASGVGLMRANLFLYGVIFLYVGLGLLAFDIAYEDFFRKWRLRLRIVLGLVYVILIIAASRLWAFVPAPIEVLVSSVVVKYAQGSKLHEIEWLPRYSELTVDISNPTSTDYDNFDAELSTDLVINHLVQSGGLGTCKLEGIHGSVDPPHWQHMHGDQPIGPMDDSRWEYQVVPKGKNGEPILPFIGADWTYRIRCDKIPAYSHLTLFGALVVVNEHVYAKPPCLAPCPWPFFDPPRPAKWVTLIANFQTSGRNRIKEIYQCGISTTCKKE